MNYKVKAPVAMIVFNRYEKTLQVFEKVRLAQPSKLYIFADGPREGNLMDIEKCNKVRGVFDRIDWPCKIILEYSENNLGCCHRPFSGISNVFQHEDVAIILEDDCVPDESFFKFCDELLDKYSNDDRIMLISGTNINTTWNRGEYSYHFSKLGGIHGWASWKRSWEKMDVDIKLWNDNTTKELLKEKLSSWFFFFRSKDYDAHVNNSNNVTTWDYQFGFSRLINNGLAIVPCSNLINNIGFDNESTHTHYTKKSKTTNLETIEMKFPLKHPPFVIEDFSYDLLFEKFLYPINIRSYIKYLLRRL